MTFKEAQTFHKGSRVANSSCFEPANIPIQSSIQTFCAFLYQKIEAYIQLIFYSVGIYLTIARLTSIQSFMLATSFMDIFDHFQWFHLRIIEASWCLYLQVNLPKEWSFPLKISLYTAFLSKFHCIVKSM